MPRGQVQAAKKIPDPFGFARMVNTDWAIDLGRRAQSGRTYLGGIVKDVSMNGITQFEIWFEKIE